VFICDECIDLCNDIIRDELPPPRIGKKGEGDAPAHPGEIKQHLDNYVIGQEAAKIAVGGGLQPLQAPAPQVQRPKKTTWSWPRATSC
jgi:hypothetical protein